MSKKKKEISLEEKMEQALVPADEQPYEVPENWCWCHISDIADVVTGSTPSKKKAEYYGGEFPFFKPADLDAEDKVYEATEYLSDEGKAVSRNIPELSTAVCCIGSIGKSGLLLREGTTNQQINSIIAKINPYYMYYYTKTDPFVYQLWSKSTSTTISMVNKSNTETVFVPLAPEDEQKRIVEAIEGMFAKLDEAKEIAEEIVEESLGYRASIYHAAFNGDLSKAWRKKNNISDDTWNIKRFDEVAEIKSNLVDPSDYQSFPHIAPDSIEKRTGRLLDYRTIEEDGVTSGKHRFYKGQILYSKIRPYLSKLVVVDFDGLCSADMYPIEVKENTKYLWHYMLSDDFLLQASSAGSRSVLPKINQKELSALKISIPSVSEQEEIVRVLDNVLEKHNILMERAELVIEQIDVMKKSILAKAFRGELGTNIESEENSIELLKQILSE